ncbi:MAG: MBOAT family O-acyltransferase [Verrucomicrobiota bacterium]
MATVFFAFQIYCDFSGYSDIAIGAAQVMGFQLMTNFNRQYFAKSITEFWKRWHISLSAWFRDYLYIPMGGNRVQPWRWQYNLFITFLVSGFWHGANWTCIVWGGINGGYLICSLWTRNLRQALCHAIGLDQFPTAHRCLRVGVTFTLVCVAWIFFRANSISDAWYILTHLFQGLHHGLKLTGGSQVFGMGLDQYELGVAALSIGFMESLHLVQRHRSLRHLLAEKPIYCRWPVYYALLLGIVFCGVFEKRQFIYFQF